MCRLGSLPVILPLRCDAVSFVVGGDGGGDKAIYIG